MKSLILIGILVLLTACQLALQDPYYCEKDADCEVKDVHNCCGYYPRCVNIAHEPDIEAVKKECEEKGFFGVCGFPDITECECRDNKCVSLQHGEVV